MLRLTSRREFIAAAVLVVLGAQNILVAQASGFLGFPRYASWLLIISGIYLGLVPLTKAPRDLGASFVMVIIGATGLYFGAELTMGTAGRMGPGYFPRLLSWLIIAIGLFVGSMSFSVEGPPIEAPKFRPMVFVMVSIIVFGFLMSGITISNYQVPGIGLLVTAIVIVVIAGMARPQFSLKESLLLGIGLSIATVLIFVYALGQALPDCPDGFRCTQYFFRGG
jgi:hypothetical protein